MREDIQLVQLSWPGLLRSHVFQYLILYTRISSVCLFGRSDFVRHAQRTPSGFLNGLDWRALVKSRPPNIGKLNVEHLFSNFFMLFFVVEKKPGLFRFFEIFPDFFSGLGWTGEYWSNCLVLILRNKEFFLLLLFCCKKIGFFKNKWFFEIFLDVLSNFRFYFLFFWGFLWIVGFFLDFFWEGNVFNFYI